MKKTFIQIKEKAFLKHSEPCKNDYKNKGNNDIMDVIKKLSKKEEIIEELMFMDALPELRKIRAGRARLHRVEDI